MPTCRLFACALLIVVACVSGKAYADPPQGRSAAQVPVGPNVTQTASGDAAGGGMYEVKRIKRTVPLDPASGIDYKWDRLYSVQDSSGGARTTYLDWDDTYLYIAVETANPAEIRVDLDGRNDGWLHGADNLSIDITPPADGGTGAPQINAQRFDMAQNREQPVWPAPPTAVGDIKASAARTPKGTYAVTLAIPHTDAIGLSLKEGGSFGIRVDSGNPKLTPWADEAVAIPVRPMLRVALSEAISANDGSLAVGLSVDGPHDITPNGEVKMTLEIKNNGAKTVRFSRVFIRGSLNDGDFVEDRKFPGVDVEPGKSFKKDLTSSVSPAAPAGALVLTGGGDLDDGQTIAALTAFNKVEPYAVYLETDGKPIPAGGDNGKDPIRTVKVFVRSRVNERVSTAVHLNLPTGWKIVDEGPHNGADHGADHSFRLTRDGDVQFTSYEFSVPAASGLGAHSIGATVDVGGKTYSALTTVVIAQ